MKRSDRRRFPRYPVQGVVGTLVPSLWVSLINLSRSGVAVLVEEKLAVGESYLLDFAYRGQNANLEVEVTWCSRRRSRRLGEGGRYVAGGRVRDIYRSNPGGLWAAIVPEP